MVSVGWIESYIKKDEEREMLGYIRSGFIQLASDNVDKNQSLLVLNMAYERLKKYFGD